MTRRVAAEEGTEELGVGPGEERRGEDDGEDRRGGGEERGSGLPPARLEFRHLLEAGGAAGEVAAVAAEAPERLLQEVRPGAEEGEVVEGEDERQPLPGELEEGGGGEPGRPLDLEGPGAHPRHGPGHRGLEVRIAQRPPGRRPARAVEGPALAARAGRHLQPVASGASGAPGVPGHRIEDRGRPQRLLGFQAGEPLRLDPAEARRRGVGAHREDRTLRLLTLSAVSTIPTISKIAERAPPPGLGEPVEGAVAERQHPLPAEHPERRAQAHRPLRSPSSTR